MEKNLKDSTKLYVAQRISTVLAADKIVLLDEGRQVAVGKHDDLLQTCLLYREIYESQVGRLGELANASADTLTKSSANSSTISSGICHDTGSASAMKASAMKRGAI